MSEGLRGAAVPEMSRVRRRSLAETLNLMERTMKPLFAFRKRVFLNPTSTGHTSFILAEVESSRNGEYKWGHYMLTLGDCHRRIQLEFFLGTKQARRDSLRKINLLIDVLTHFRDALLKEHELIENFQQSKKRKRSKANGKH